MTRPTSANCADRGHPLVTHNERLDQTLCLCGQRIEDGLQPVDWDAKWAAWHDHDRDEPCDCYVAAQRRSREIARQGPDGQQLEIGGAT